MCLSLQIAEKRHHSNAAAAAQRVLSDFTQGYLGRHTFELAPLKRTALSRAAPPATAASATKLELKEKGERAFCLLGGVGQRRVDTGESGRSNNRETFKRSAADNKGEWRWTMRRQGERLSFLLDPSRCSAARGGTEEGKGAVFSNATFGVKDLQKKDAELDTKGCLNVKEFTGSEDVDPHQELTTKGWLEGW